MGNGVPKASQIQNETKGPGYRLRRLERLGAWKSQEMLVVSDGQRNVLGL